MNFGQVTDRPTGLHCASLMCLSLPNARGRLMHHFVGTPFCTKVHNTLWWCTMQLGGSQWSSVWPLEPVLHSSHYFKWTWFVDSCLDHNFTLRCTLIHFLFKDTICHVMLNVDCYFMQSVPVVKLLNYFHYLYWSIQRVMTDRQLDWYADRKWSI